VRQVVLKPAGPHYLRNPGASGQAGDHEGGRGDQERVDNYTAVVRVYANWMDWTDQTDVLHALDWRPPHQGGRRWKITAGIAAPGPWATWRLAHWRHADGTIAAPAS